MNIVQNVSEMTYVLSSVVEARRTHAEGEASQTKVATLETILRMQGSSSQATPEISTFLHEEVTSLLRDLRESTRLNDEA